MKLALVHDWLTGMRGGEKCLAALCRRFPDARLFTLLHAPGSTSPDIERMQITTSFLQHVPGVEARYRYLLPLMPKAVERFAIPADVDLVVSFSHAVAKGVRVPVGVPHVSYCFTPMRYAWHLRGEYFRSTDELVAVERDTELSRPGYGVFSGKLARRPVEFARDTLLDRMRDWDRRSAERVSHFVAISRTVAARIRECYGRESTVIYPPVDTDFYTPAQQPREDFYLVVSALVPYKRIDLAIATCNYLGKRLIVIGRGPETEKLKTLAGPSIEFLGWQTDEEIREHLRRCRALLFPGHEDFGIVPLEASACGAPVIALERGGATETILAGDENSLGTGFFFREPTVDSLATAIEMFEARPELFCPQLAREQAERFSAQRFERELVKYIESVVVQAASA
ncbi:MAG: glycosyltransferase [Pirellulales bacterium]|nr:glycosyltransferase [Pirellulales bacterium]